MQFISLFLFALICGYSLVTSAPVNQTNSDSLQAKQQKAVEIAGRLLKQIANERLAAHEKQETSNDEEKENKEEPVSQSESSKVQSDSSKESSTEEEQESDEDLLPGYAPSIDDLYQMFGNRYPQRVDDDEEEEQPAFEIDADDEDEYMFPVNKEFFDNYWPEQSESDENVKPMVHTPVMDDSVMTAEKKNTQEQQQQQRRRRSLY